MSNFAAGRAPLHAVLGGVDLVDLSPGQELTTPRQVEPYRDRAAAVARIRETVPGFEPEPWEPPPPPTREEREREAMRIASQVAVTDKLKADALDQATIEAVAGIYDPWEPGLAVTVGQVLRWDGTLVEVLQAHTTQADWTPDVVPALFRVYRTDTGGGPIEWIAGIAVTAGEQVIYQGTTYNVLQSHTTQVGWEPPNVPALYAPA